MGIRNAEALTILELAGNNLTKLKGINTLTQLKKLYVSFNELVKLDDIAGMVQDPKYLRCGLSLVTAMFNHNLFCL